MINLLFMILNNYLLIFNNYLLIYNLIFKVIKHYKMMLLMI